MLNYKIEEIDYITYQLFDASQNKLVTRKRLRNRIILPVLYLVFGLIAYFIGKQFYMGIIFVVLAVLWFVSYPFYSRWLYKDYYRKHVRSNNKEMFGRNVSMEIHDKKLVLSDLENESHISLNEIIAIHEISTHIFVKLKGGKSLIIPKHSFRELTMVANFINQLCKISGVKISKNIDWKWK